MDVRANARVASFPRGEHPERRIERQPLGVVGVLVAGQATVDRLTKQIRRRELRVASGARIAEVSLDQHAQTEALVQLARQQQPGVGGHRRSEGNINALRALAPLPRAPVSRPSRPQPRTPQPRWSRRHSDLSRGIVNIRLAWRGHQVRGRRLRDVMAAASVT